MINANELRIGNAVSDPIGLDKMVSIEVFKNIRDGLRYTGISLTPEILEKCGFFVSFSSDPQDFNASKVYKLNNLEIYQPYEISNNFIFSYCEDKILELKYLHQLQNLVFALTNTELTYTP